VARKPFLKACETRFSDYCAKFWDWGRSDYIRGLKLRGKSIGREYVGTNSSYIKRFLEHCGAGTLSLSKVTSSAI
jgi:hypothetical protein